MRLPSTAIAFAALLALAACGGDEPEETLPPRPAATRPAAPDTSLGDTAGRPAGQPGAANQPGGQAGQQTGTAAQGGQTGQPTGAQPSGQTGGQAGAPTSGSASGQRLYTVQVAAFTSPDSAQKWTGRLNSLELPVWTSMAELGGTTYYRVRVGAVSNVADARRLGGLLSQRFEWPVWVAPVTPADRMPEGAVASTQRVLGGN